MRKKVYQWICFVLALLTAAAMLPVMPMEAEAAYANQTITIANVDRDRKSPSSYGPALTYDDVTAIVEDYWNTVTHNGSRTVYWNKHIRKKGSVESMAFNDTVTTKACQPGDGDHLHTGGSCPGGSSSNNANCTARCTSNGYWYSSSYYDAQCAGFADYMSYVVFKNNDRNWKKYSGTQLPEDYQVKPGDVVRVYWSWDSSKAASHSMFIYKVSGGKAYYIECNYNGKCRIYNSRSVSVSKVVKTVRETSGGYLRSSPAVPSVKSYTIRFDANKPGDADNITGTMPEQACWVGISTTLNANTYAVPRYFFAGWNTEKDGSGTAFKDKASIGDLTTENGATVTLYAQWKSQDQVHHATNLEIKLNGNYDGYNLYKEPYTESDRLTTTLIPKGTHGIATKIVKNKYDNYWYYVAVNGVSGWVYGGNCDVVQPATNAVTVSNLTNLSKYKRNSGKIDITEILTANSCTITKITGAIRNYSNAVQKNINGEEQTASVTGSFTSFNVKNDSSKKINLALTPKKMEPGLYQYTLDVSVKLLVTDGAAMQEKTFDNIRVLADGFESYASSASSLKITLDANGGSCVQTERLVYSGKAIGALPTPGKINASFLGWYTDKTGGSKVTETSTFTKDGTLYARWETKHIHLEVADPAKAPSCTETGLTEGKHCDTCKAVLVAQQTVSAKGHSYRDGKCNVCGAPDPAAQKKVLRVAGENRFETAFRLADQLKKELKADKFENIIVASGATYADALPGSYLAAVKKAPILLSYTKGDFNDRAKAYIRENLVPGGTVYILGDVTAVPASMEQGLEGYTVKRLPGANRFETNMLILKEAGVKPGDEILICTGADYADALSASAVGKPILLVYKKLYDYQREFLEGLPGSTFCIIGGESAVRASIEEEIRTFGPTERLGGKDRLETSHKVAQRYFGNADGAVLAYGWNFPDGLCGGSLAYAKKMPLILSHSKEKLYGFTAEYTGSAGIKSGCVLGTGELIPDNAVRRIFGMAENAPITTAE